MTSQNEYTQLLKHASKADAFASFVKSRMGYVPSFAESLEALSSVVSVSKAYRPWYVSKLLGPHDYSCVMLNLADEDVQEVLDLQDRLNPADIIELEPTPHITVKYGLHTSDAGQVRQLIETFGPVSVTLRLPEVFHSDEQDVLVIAVESEQLHELNRLICDALEHTDTHNEYKPHLTIAYLKPGTGTRYRALDDLDDKQLTFSECVFSDQAGNKTALELASYAWSEKLAKEGGTRYKEYLESDQTWGEFVKVSSEEKAPKVDLEKLRREAESLEFDHPRVTCEDGIVRLYATSFGYDGKHTERMIGYLGLQEEGIRRLLENLRQLAKTKGLSSSQEKDWEPTDERVVKWNVEQTKHLYKRLNQRFVLKFCDEAWLLNDRVSGRLDWYDSKEAAEEVIKIESLEGTHLGRVEPDGKGTWRVVLPSGEIVEGNWSSSREALEELHFAQTHRTRPRRKPKPSLTSGDLYIGRVEPASNGKWRIVLSNGERLEELYDSKQQAIQELHYGVTGRLLGKQQKSTQSETVTRVIAQLAGSSNLAPLTRIRPALAAAGIGGKAAQDQALINAWREGKISGVSFEGRHGSTQEERDSFLRWGEQKIGYFAVRPHEEMTLEGAVSKSQDDADEEEIADGCSRPQA